MTMYSVFQQLRRCTNCMTLIANLTSTELREMCMEYLQRVWHANSEWLLLRTPGSFPIWTCYNC